MKQTAVEWLIKEFNLENYKATCDFALEKEKKQIIDAYEEQNVKWDEFIDEDGRLNLTNKYRNPIEYYNETYGSKGSDEHIEHNLDEIEKSEKPINLLSNQEGIFYSHNDVLEMMKKFHTYEMNIELNLLKLTPLKLTSSQTEISDEEIEKQSYKQTSIEWLIKELKLEGYDHTIKVAKKMYDKEIDECSKKNSIQKINPSDFIDEMFKNAGKRD